MSVCPAAQPAGGQTAGASWERVVDWIVCAWDALAMLNSSSAKKMIPSRKTSGMPRGVLGWGFEDRTDAMPVQSGTLLFERHFLF